MRQPSEIDLMRYADGEVSGEVRREISLFLQKDDKARRTVRMFRWTALMVEEEMSTMDFSEVPDRLKKSVHPAPKPNRSGLLGLSASTLQLAAFATMSAGAVLWFGVVIERPLSSDPSGTPLALGPVASSSALSQALDSIAATPKVEVGALSLVGTARFKDKFGNRCQEVDVYDADRRDLPAAVAVACQDVSGQWDIVGAVHTTPGFLGGEAPYVANGNEARDAMAGILNMLGAKQHTTHLRPETETP